MNSNNSEKTSIFIVISVILIVLAILVFSIISSNNDLTKNSNATNEQLNKNDNTSTDTQSPSDNPPEVNQTVETEIASYTSTLYDRDKNRVDNITLAISKLNNKVIKKGEEFSFNNTIGPMTAEQGFKDAIGFDSKGRNIKIPGGGMCQISSTIYNCALISNLQITERHAHSKRVYYVPVDRDATIYYGSLDLKFINNTDGDIRILAANTDTNVSIKFIKITTKNETH